MKQKEIKHFVLADHGEVSYIMYQQKPYECFLCSKSLVADTLQEPGWLFQYVIVVSGWVYLPTIMPEASYFRGFFREVHILFLSI